MRGTGSQVCWLCPLSEFVEDELGTLDIDDVLLKDLLLPSAQHSSSSGLLHEETRVFRS